MIGPKIDDDSKTDVITATGGRVAYFSGKADLMADKVIVYRKEKRAEFYGNVVMLVKAKKDQDKPPAEEPVPDVNLNTETETPKPGEFVTLTPEEKKRYDELRDQKNARDYPFHVAAEKIVYWYAKGSRHATIDGNPRARQDFPDNAWREGWAKTGTYDGEKEFLHLAGDAGKRDAHYRASNKDQFNAEWLEFSTKDNQTEEDNDLKTGPTDGVIVDSSKEDTRPPKPGQPTTPPPVKTNGGPK
jgi:lipopolysaccharide export system protein LptA